MEEVTGTNADETFNAPVLSSTTGADITTLNSGDVIDGGAGTDTLNITATADDNNSLTGVTIKNFEVVNITGADNIGSTTSSTSAATNITGVAATDVIVISAPQPIGEVQTIDFKDLKIDSANGGIVVGGIAVALEDGDTADEIASAVKTALAAKIGTASTTMEDVVSVSAKGSVVTVQFNYKDGTNVTATSLYNPNALTVANDSTSAPTYVATQNTTAISGAAVSSVAGNLQTVPVTVTINGVKHAAGTVDLTGGDGSTASTNNYFSATATTVAAAEKAAANAAADLVVSALNKIVGGAAVAARTAEVGELSITAKAIGASLPEVSVTQVDTVLSTAETTATDSEVVVGVAAESTTGAEAQALTVTIGTLEGSDKFSVYIDGLLVGEYTNAATSSPANTLAGIVSLVNGTLGTGVAVVSSTASAGGSIVITAPEAGVALPAISIAGTDASATNALVITQTSSRDNIVAATAKTTSTTSDASIAASSFTGAEQIWLKGDSNTTNVTGVTTQTIGLSGIASMDNEVNYGATTASGSIVVNGAKGALSVSGAKLTTLNVSGTGSTGLTLTDGSSTDTIKTIAVSTSGGTVLDTAAATAVTALTQSGKGGVTLKNAGTKLASVTTGEGADNIKINTTTAKDNANTAADETVTASVSTGDGADKVTVATTGAGGLTSVETGAGADTVYVTTVGTGVSTINTGADNDTVDIIGTSLGTYPNLSINAGSGSDTLVLGGATFSAVDYLRLNGALSDFEGVRFSSAVGGIDASKLAIGSITGFTFNAGSNVITEVGAGQSLTLASVTAATTAATNQPAGSNYAGTATALTASAAGYVAGTTGGAPTTVYGGSLDVSSKSDANALEVNGTSATVAVTSTGAATTGIAADVTLTTSDIQSLTVNLTSARGTGANVVTEYKAAFDAGTIVDAAATLGNTHLESLASVTVTGTGGFTINTGSVAKTLADLTTIDVSGMVAMAELNALGEATATNVSTTAITLNANVSESVLLGGARDTIDTDSTVANPDTITGFTLTPDATTPTNLDTARSDVLDISTSATLTFAKFITTATTYAGALTDAGAASGANLLFVFGGDTYAYVDLASGGSSVAGLDDGDLLVKLVGTYDLDLLISAVS